MERQITITEREALEKNKSIQTYLQEHLNSGYTIENFYQNPLYGSTFILHKTKERMYTLEHMKEVYIQGKTDEHHEEDCFDKFIISLNT